MSTADAPPIPDTQPRPVAPVEGLAPGTVADWMDWATRTLEAASPSARADAEVLMAAQLDLPRSQLHLRMDDPVLAARVLQYAAAVERRRIGEPVAYITGWQGFWSIELSVNPAVLIPRADTETLLEWALQLATVIPAKGVWPIGDRLNIGLRQSQTLQSDARTATSEALDSRRRGNDGMDRPVRVADLGTGSGAIALALGRELGARARIVATDRSDAALNLARDNARALKIETVEFRAGDWFGAAREDERFELIVSNPPYIAEGDAHLDALRYEPRMALTSGADGLDAIREIVSTAPAHLAAGGWLLLEHGHDHGAAVRALLTQAGFVEVQTRRDFGGNERASGGRLE